jgi:hypothetical protein
MQVGGEAPAWFAAEQPLRLTISEALDHPPMITPRVISVKLRLRSSPGGDPTLSRGC